MPGLGFHYAFAKLISQNPPSPRAIVGALLPDIIKYLTGNRFYPHFSEHCGCIFPYPYDLVRLTSTNSDSLQSATDHSPSQLPILPTFGDANITTQAPVSNLQTFITTNWRLIRDEPEYAYQILGHLAADRAYNALMLETFDFTHDQEGLIIARATGKHLSIADYRHAAAVIMYPQLDQLMFQFTSTTLDELQRVAKILQPRLPAACFSQVTENLYGNYGTPWHDTEYFTKSDVLKFVNQAAVTTSAFWHLPT